MNFKLGEYLEIDANTFANKMKIMTQNLQNDMRIKLMGIIFYKVAGKKKIKFYKIKNFMFYV